MAATKRWKPRELRQRLRELGCRHLRTSGSHEIWALPNGVPLPPFVGVRDNELANIRTLRIWLEQKGIEL